MQRRPYYEVFFLPVFVSTFIATILLFLPPWTTQQSGTSKQLGINNKVLSFQEFRNTLRQNTNKTGSSENPGNTDATTLLPPTSSTHTAVLMGDIMLSRSIGARNKKEGYNRAFSGYNPLHQITECTKGNCTIFANLESPFSTSDTDKHERIMRFKTNTGSIATLTGLRGNNNLIVTLANNHINNAGGLGVELTIDILNTNNIFHVGAGNSKEDANKILVYTKDNITRCIGGYSYEGNGGKYGGRQLYRNKVNLSGMLQDLAIMKEQYECDIKALMLHRGAEYHLNPNKTQINQAHTLIDNGADIIIGGHSHIPGKIEVYSGKYIFYSLGNALFDQDRGMNAGAQNGMDKIYDNVLGKNTVPTYIALLPEIKIEKVYTNKTTTITLEKIHGARIEKGVYTGLDDKTLENIIEKIMPKEKVKDEEE